jgi:hypothetical protein
MTNHPSELKPMSPIEFMVRSDLKRHMETATQLRKIRETRSWLKEPPYKALSFEEFLEERYDRAPAWFQRVSAILDEHPPSKILANWRRFAPEFEEREEDFDWGDA